MKKVSKSIMDKRFEGCETDRVSITPAYYNNLQPIQVSVKNSSTVYRMDIELLKIMLKHFSFKLVPKRVHTWLEDPQLSGFEGNILKTILEEKEERE